MTSTRYSSTEAVKVFFGSLDAEERGVVVLSGKREGVYELSFTGDLAKYENSNKPSSLGSRIRLSYLLANGDFGDMTDSNETFFSNGLFGTSGVSNSLSTLYLLLYRRK